MRTALNFERCRAHGLRILDRPNIQHPTVLAVDVEALLLKLESKPTTEKEQNEPLERNHAGQHR
jgi:hypothetical protein